EGTLDDPPLSGRPCCEQPGPLRPILEALDLPTVAVLPSPRRESFHLPRIPDGVDAVFFDELDCPDDFEFFRRMVAWTSKKPVLGAVETLPEVREALRQAPRDRPFPEELLARLGVSFLRFADLPAIRDLAQKRLFPWPVPEPAPRRTPRF